MEDQNTQQLAVPQSHKKFLYAAAGFSLLAVILLAVVLVKILQPANQLPTVSKEVQQNPAAQTNGTGQQPLAGQTATTPMPINNKQDVSNALQQIDNANPAAVGTDLNQNTSDASQFSQ